MERFILRPLFCRIARVAGLTSIIDEGETGAGRPLSGRLAGPGGLSGKVVHRNARWQIVEIREVPHLLVQQVRGLEHLLDMPAAWAHIDRRGRFDQRDHHPDLADRIEHRRRIAWMPGTGGGSMVA